MSKLNPINWVKRTPEEIEAHNKDLSDKLTTIRHLVELVHESLESRLHEKVDIKKGDPQILVKQLLDGYRKVCREFKVQDEELSKVKRDKAGLEKALKQSQDEKFGLEKKLRGDIDRIKNENSDNTWTLESKIRSLESDKKGMKARIDNVQSELQTQLQRKEQQHQTENIETQNQYQAQIDSLRSDFTRQKKDLEHKMSEMIVTYESERDELARQSRDKASKLKKTFEEEKARLEGRLEEERQRLKGELEEQADRSRKDIETLNGALLKRDKFTPIADRELKDRFLHLDGEIENLARVDWKLNDTDWRDGVLSLSKNPKKLKRYILQDELWAVLYETIFCSPFRVFGTEGRILETQWSDAFPQKERGAANENGLYKWPMATWESERWRYETIKNCQEALDQPASEFDSRTKLKRAFKNSIDGIIKRFLDILGKISNMNEDIAQLSAEIPHKAARMWLEMGTQRCRILVVMPGSNLSSQLERVKSAQQGSLELALRAELLRFGNSKGQNLEKKEIIGGCDRITIPVSLR